MQSGIEIFLAGQQKLTEDHTEREQAKLHTLRGGSAGCLLSDGSVLGACPHKTLARFMGYQMNVELAQNYFDAGVANEFVWERNFVAALGKDRVRCEEDIPVTYQLGKYKITGRPDLVVGDIADGTWTPSYGYELKSAHTLKSASKKLYGWEVSDDHLCQAGFYAKVLDVPYSILYNVHLTGELPDDLAEKYGQNALEAGKLEIPIRWVDDVLHYQLPNGKIVKTLITWQGILDFYQAVVEMYETKQVGILRQALVTATGNRLYYDPNKYNEFLLAVPLDRGWDTFVSYCEKASKVRKLLEYSKGKYRVIDLPFTQPHTTNNKYEYIYSKQRYTTYSSLNAARDAFYD